MGRGVSVLVVEWVTAIGFMVFGVINWARVWGDKYVSSNYTRREQEVITYEGKSDTVFMDFLTHIQWRGTYWVLKGEYPDNALFRHIVGESYREGSGMFSYRAPVAMGGQTHTLSWCRDEERGVIVLHFIEITQPK